MSNIKKITYPPDFARKIHNAVDFLFFTFSPNRPRHPRQPPTDQTELVPPSAKRHFWRDDLRVVRLAPCSSPPTAADQTELVPPGQQRHFWRDDLRVVRLAPCHPTPTAADQTELVPPGRGVISGGASCHPPQARSVTSGGMTSVSSGSPRAIPANRHGPDGAGPSRARRDFRRGVLSSTPGAASLLEG